MATNIDLSMALDALDKAKAEKESPKPARAKRETMNSGTLLRYTVTDNDDTIIKIIKEELNERDLTMGDLKDFCKRLEERTDMKAKAYNLNNGLKKNGSINTDTATIWLEFLECNIHLKKRDK